MNEMTSSLPSSFFPSCPQALRETMLAETSSAQLEPGDFFYREDGACSAVAWLAEGRIRVFKRCTSGREISLYHVNQGETCLVNILCTILNSPAPASAQAEIPVRALLIPTDRFRAWVRQHESLQDYVFGAMSYRVIELMTLVEGVAFQRIDERLCRMLRNEFDRAKDSVSLNTTHEEIAAELGTAREVVSRLLKDLERTGAIELGRGKITLRDDETLAHHLGTLANP